MDASEVYPNLWQGALPSSAKDVARFGAVVSLVPTLDWATAERLHLCWPIVDGPLPDLRLLEGAVGFAAHSVSQGRATLVHCGAGINRSGLVCALTLLHLTTMAPDEVVALIRTKRSVALTNPEFLNFVLGR